MSQIHTQKCEMIQYLCFAIKYSFFFFKVVRINEKAESWKVTFAKAGECGCLSSAE